jgi:hypothetical protein
LKRKITKAEREKAKLRQSRFRARKKASGKVLRWVPFQGLDKIGTEKVERKDRMIPLASRNGRKPGTWLGKPPKRIDSFRKRKKGEKNPRFKYEG